MWKILGCLSMSLCLLGCDAHRSRARGHPRQIDEAAYSGAWRWQLVDPGQAQHANCGTFVPGRLEIEVTDRAMIVTEQTGIDSVVYMGTFDYDEFEVSSDLGFGLGTQHLEGRFLSTTSFEADYRVIAQVLECDATRAVVGDRLEAPSS